MANPSRAPVERALQILETMNRASNLQVHEISSGTGIPQSSVIRLLDQLITAGYVDKISRRDGYQLTSKVRRLSWGFRFDDIVAEVAAPLMSEFTCKYRWPVFIGLADGDQVIVLYGTAAESAVAVDPLVHEVPTPFLMSALGKAYLAFCPEWERKAIISRLLMSRRSTDKLAQEPGTLRHILQTVRKTGYAITDEGLRFKSVGVSTEVADARKRATGLAVPVLSQDRVIACLSLRFMRSVIKDTDVANRYLEPLKQLATEIAEEVHRASAQ